MDISPDLIDIVQDQIKKGEYRTVQEFIIAAIQNQIYLINQPTYFTTEIITSESPSNIENVKKQKDSKQLLSLENVDVKTVKPNDEMLYSTLSGFWNKFLPVKITVRVLANLMARFEGPVLLDALQEHASLEARSIGLTLVKTEKGSGRKRGDRLFTGLPVKRNSEKSRSRFKSHFVGTLSRNHIDGMPGTLRLIDIRRGSNGKNYASLTHLGLEFSTIRNPIIDHQDYRSTLSDDEQKFLLKLLETHLPSELDEITFVLRLIEKGYADTKELIKMILESRPGLTKTQITTYLSGILNRLVDLGLVIRRYAGLHFIYEVSIKGKRLILEGQ